MLSSDLALARICSFNLEHGRTMVSEAALV
jgi:hypothetical protein